MVRIITDSAADFEPFELEKLNIACVPLKVMIADAEYEENVNLGKAQFYELLASTGATPKTSQPSPQHLADLFAAAKAAGDEAVYISISSGISGTYQTACMTREDAECEDCYVVDSLNATAPRMVAPSRNGVLKVIIVEQIHISRQNSLDAPFRLCTGDLRSM